MDEATETKPPYGGFRTFWNFIGQLHEHRPLPQILDRSVMGQKGGSARAELYLALRFFGLIDGDKRPTPALHALVAEEPNVEKLRTIVEARYQPLIALDLNTATPRQVDEVLEGMGATPSTVARSRTFFLNAAEDAGIEVGRLLKTARAPTGQRRVKRTPKARPGGNGDAGDGGSKVPITGKLPPVIGALVAKLPTEEDGWNEDLGRQWLSLVAPAIAYDYGLDLGKLTKGVE